MATGRLVVTAGDKFTDIDAFASIVAYCQLLELEGREVQAVISGPLNESIPAMLRSSEQPYQTEYTSQPGDRFAVLDVSDPPYVARFVDESKVEIIIDHHPGFERYWQDRATTTQIELVGAVCTQVYEHWAEAGRQESMPETTAELLAAGILDNTLNFTAEATTDRDRRAYDWLLKKSRKSSSWAASYFLACQESVDIDPGQALENDSKLMELVGFEGIIKVGQLVVWDAKKLVKVLQDLQIATGSSYETPWFINVISISDGHSTLLCQSPELQRFLTNLLGAEFKAGVMKANRLWLRKEISSAAIEKHR